MKKQKSERESFIAEFFFAVYPFSISFHDQDYANYRLYFEKSLQILNKFDIPQHPPADNQFVYFPQPEHIQSFRILTERNLAFKWSLYNGKDTEGEEFLQSHTIHLASFWNDLLLKKENIKPFEIVFKKTRCRLFYLVAAGNNEQIHQNMQKYFRIPAHGHQELEKQHHLQPFISNARISNISKKENQANQLPKKDKNKSPLPAAEQPQISEPNSPTSNILFSNAKSNFLNPQPHSKLKSEAKLYQSINGQLLSKSDAEIGETINSQLRLALSLQEIQIGKQIQQRIKQDQQTPNSPKKKRQPSNESAPSVQEQLLARYRQQKSQRITESQKLNDKGEIVVTPIYAHLKYYIIFIAIIAIFTGLVFMNPQSKTYQVPPPPPPTTSKKARHRQADHRRGGKSGRRRQ